MGFTPESAGFYTGEYNASYLPVPDEFKT